MYHDYAMEIVTGKKSRRRLSRGERKAMKDQAEAIKNRFREAGLL